MFDKKFGFFCVWKKRANLKSLFKFIKTHRNLLWVFVVVFLLCGIMLPFFAYLDLKWTALILTPPSRYCSARLETSHVAIKASGVWLLVMKKHLSPLFWGRLRMWKRQLLGLRENTPMQIHANDVQISHAAALWCLLIGDGRSFFMCLFLKVYGCFHQRDLVHFIQTRVCFLGWWRSLFVRV